MVSKPWPILLTVRMPDHGGCERDLTRIATHIDRSRFEPHVGCFFRKGVRLTELSAAAVPVEEFPLRSYKSIGSMAKTVSSFKDYVRRHNIQLVHAYDVPTSAFLVPAGRLVGVPALVASQLSLRELNSKPDQLKLRVADRCADKVVVNSKAVLEDLVAHYGVPREKLALIYNGVDASVYRPGPRVRQPGLEDSSLVIGSVAALREEKQFHLLVDAFAKVRSLRPGLRLLMVGGGRQKEPLQARARELQISDSVVWVDTQANVAQWMRAIDIFVLPSRSESFPNALLESMASGCCPVGSTVGGIPELIENERSGLLFPSGNADALAACLARLIAEDDLRAQLADAASERAHCQFSLDKFIANTSNLYERLLT